MKIILKIFSALSILAVFVNLVIFIGAWLFDGYIGFYFVLTIPATVLIFVLWGLCYVATPINNESETKKQSSIGLKKKFVSLWLCIGLIVCAYGYIDDGTLQGAIFDFANLTVFYAIFALVFIAVVGRYMNVSSGTFNYSRFFYLILAVATIGILISLLILGSVSYQVGG